ncbi:MAG: restriction endonuclease [Romboutsia sp.]|nr:restriction endonuclease [Romboutsia sp.]
MNNERIFENLNKVEFEYLVKKLLNKLDISIKSEENIDENGMIAFCKNPLIGGEYIVLIKQSSSPINRKTIESEFKKIREENVTKLIIITNGTFTTKVKDYSYNSRLELIDGDTLLNLLKEHNINIEEEIRILKNMVIESEEVDDYKNYYVDCSVEDEEIKKIRKYIRDNRRGNEIENLELKIELIKAQGKKFDKLISLNKKKLAMNDIYNTFDNILQSPYIQNMSLLPKNEYDKIKKVINIIEESINIRNGEFSNILSNYMNITEKMSNTTLKNKEIELYNIFNIMKILEISDEYKKIEELKSIVEDILKQELEEKETALRETGYEMRKTESKFNDFYNMINKEADEKLGIVHYKNIEMFNSVIEKQVNDIELLNKELKKPGTIKIFNIFAKRISEKEINELIILLQNNVDKTDYYKKRIQEMYLSGQNKFLLEYKERVLCEIFKVMLDCKIEKEICKNNINNEPRILGWNLIDEIIDELEEAVPINNKMLNKININKIEYPEQVIEMVRKTTDNAQKYLNELENLSNNISNQIIYIRKLITILNENYNKSEIYLYEFEKIGKNNEITSKDLMQIDIYEFLKTIDKDILKDEIKKIKALFSMYRFK